MSAWNKDTMTDCYYKLNYLQWSEVEDKSNYWWLYDSQHRQTHIPVYTDIFCIAVIIISIPREDTYHDIFREDYIEM